MCYISSRHIRRGMTRHVMENFKSYCFYDINTRLKLFSDGHRSNDLTMSEALPHSNSRGALSAASRDDNNNKCMECWATVAVPATLTAAVPAALCQRKSIKTSSSTDRSIYRGSQYGANFHAPPHASLDVTLVTPF